MKTSDILLFGALGVGAFVLVNKASDTVSNVNKQIEAVEAPFKYIWDTGSNIIGGAEKTADNFFKGTSFYSNLLPHAADGLLSSWSDAIFGGGQSNTNTSTPTTSVVPSSWTGGWDNPSTWTVPDINSQGFWAW